MKRLPRLLAIAVIWALVTILFATIGGRSSTSPFEIEGPAMADTLRDGEVAIANAQAYQDTGPARGDIVVFHPPYDPAIYLIERIVGLPGETLIIRGGNVYLMESGKEQQLPERYLNENSKGKTYDCGSPLDTGSVKTYVVPNDEYFILGDNRLQSLDSRCFQGEGGKTYVHRNALYGKVQSVIRDGGVRELPAASYQQL